MKIDNVYQNVHNILERLPSTRDDDTLLFMEILIHYKGQNFARFALIPDLLSEIRLNRLPSFESIRRSRQKAQELYPLLRGVFYAKRHGKIDETQKALREIEKGARS